MKIKRINIGGNREEINKNLKEHIPNLIDSVKRDDLIFTPDKLIKKLFKGSTQEYTKWLIKNKLYPSQINLQEINQKQELIKELKSYTIRLIDEAKNDSMFANELGNLTISRWIDSFDTLENHIYDLSDFSRVEFIKIADEFKKSFTTYSPFAFLTIDEINRQIKIVESHKVIFLSNQKLPMGNRRGTPVGQEAKKLYQTFFTTIGYKGKGVLTEGLNHNRANFKNFNFNLNIETRTIIDIIYDKLNYNREDTQIAFIFGAYGKKLYFESDIKGLERKKEELEALAITEETKNMIGRELHKKRQGSIAIDKTTVEVKNRVEHPKINNKKINKNYTSDALKEFEKNILVRQQGYAQLAKEKIDDALNNRNQYIDEFNLFLTKGMSISEALSKFSQRYANNPYIKGIIETAITAELQLQHIKDIGIEELNNNINILNSEKQDLYRDIDIKETKIASLTQKIDSIVVSHTKQLQDIEVNLYKLVQEKDKLIIKSNKQLAMIEELEKLINKYEHTLRKKDYDIKDKNIAIERLKEKFSNKIESSQKVKELESDNRYYSKQIEQLKEENRLTISTMNLLKANNRELEVQIERLKKG